MHRLGGTERFLRGAVGLALRLQRGFRYKIGLSQLVDYRKLRTLQLATRSRSIDDPIAPCPTDPQATLGALGAQ